MPGDANPNLAKGIEANFASCTGGYVLQISRDLRATQVWKESTSSNA